MNNLKILLVDDEEDLVHILAERLQFRGFEADAAVNSSEAVNLASRKEYDVSLLDVKLKGICGIELMKTLKEQQPNMKIILITGHGTQEEGKKGLLLGASNYLVKPINIDNLIDRIYEAVKS